jgi:hypothetical protein
MNSGRLFLAAALALADVTLHAAEAALPKSSPFLPTAGAVDPATAPGETIEFAAVRTIGARTEIDLYDTQGKKHHWIPLGGSADGMSAMSYDAKRDQVMAKIGGVNKLLKLRQSKGTAAGNAAMFAGPQPVASFATPAPVVQKIQPPPGSDAAADPAASAPTTVAPTTAAPTPAQPAAPLSVARQEEEARMLVSDLLEIGMAQRKAYEDKQKQAADPNAVPPQPTAANPQGPTTPPNGE